jgi:hypothetical protein
MFPEESAAMAFGVKLSRKYVEYVSTGVAKTNIENANITALASLWAAFTLRDACQPLLRQPMVSS